MQGKDACLKSCVKLKLGTHQELKSLDLVDRSCVSIASTMNTHVGTALFH